MAKATSIKEALKRWEGRTKEKATEATDIQLQFEWPPIEKMDNTLSSLVKCEKLSLSTNMIEKIFGLSGMVNLKILSLARNNIKSLTGLETIPQLEQLWVSNNNIEKLKGIESLVNLKVLYIGNNLVKEWAEFNKLIAVQKLEDLLFVGNPLMENLDDSEYKREVTRKLYFLKKLDGEPIIRVD